MEVNIGMDYTLDKRVGRDLGSREISVERLEERLEHIERKLAELAQNQVYMNRFMNILIYLHINK